VKDVRNTENDKRIARHVLAVHQSAGEPSSSEEPDDADKQFLKWAAPAPSFLSHWRHAGIRKGVISTCIQ